MKPTIGRIVHYCLNEFDASRINKRRQYFDQYRRTPMYRDSGYAAHAGNDVQAGDYFPMIITRILGDLGYVNGQVLLDGTDNLWVTSVGNGSEQTQWNWPPRETQDAETPTKEAQ